MHFKQNNKESKTYVQGLRSFSNTLPRGIKGLLKKNGYNYSEIISKWNFLVGKEISNYSYPLEIKVVKGNASGTLVLSVERGNEINIEYSKNEIINKINSYFGYKLINSVRLKTSRTENKKNKKNKIVNKLSKNLNKKINEIKSESIRNSLSELLDEVNND
jgi:hypothetical protein|tara:strand:- start:62 stop:544 length:483 start_codon:yes stop_codon:yes gene_type:complete